MLGVDRFVSCKSRLDFRRSSNLLLARDDKVEYGSGDRKIETLVYADITECSLRSAQNL